MNYLSSAQTQVYALGVFLGVGFLLAVLFELCRFLRVLLAGDGVKAVRSQDVLYSILSFLILYFAFLAFADGTLRLHLLIAAAFGFLAFRLTLQKHVRRLLDRLARCLNRASTIVHRPFSAAAEKLKRLFEKLLCRIRSVLQKVFAKKQNTTTKKLPKNKKDPCKS